MVTGSEEGGWVNRPMITRMILICAIVRFSILFPHLSLCFCWQVFELMRKQEETRQSEESARKAEFQAIQAESEIVCTPPNLNLMNSL